MAFCLRVSNALFLLTWPKTPLSIVVKRRGKTPLPRVRMSMAKTYRFWPVSLSYFCAYLGGTRYGERDARGVGRNGVRACATPRGRHQDDRRLRATCHSSHGGQTDGSRLDDDRTVILS